MGPENGHRDATTSKVPVCPGCRQASMRRVERVGFLQQRILPAFGLYPWECTLCRKQKYLRIRGVKRRRRAAPRREFD